MTDIKELQKLCQQYPYRVPMVLLPTLLDVFIAADRFYASSSDLPYSQERNELGEALIKTLSLIQLIQKNNDSNDDDANLSFLFKDKKLRDVVKCFDRLVGSLQKDLSQDAADQLGYKPLKIFQDCHAKINRAKD